MSASPRRITLALPVAIVLIAASQLVTLTSGALFTDTDSGQESLFTSGTVILDATRTIDFNATNMAPGDTKTGTIQIQNNGTLEMRYAVGGTTTGATDLAAALQVDARIGAATVYSGPLSTFTIGDPAPGQQLGDRALAAGAGETLDIAVTLPLTADNALQGKTTTATLTFTAEQTANNS